uniref:SFRICE_029414 n=1 Tax=Spodoptera frugiperda TaxID=7108 RepID=A0A2H1VAI1_SPOFR
MNDCLGSHNETNQKIKYLCLFPGVDVTANQDEISSHETFQLEFDWATRRWYIRTMQDRYWTLETGGGIQASGDNKYVYLQNKTGVMTLVSVGLIAKL